MMVRINNSLTSLLVSWEFESAALLSQPMRGESLVAPSTSTAMSGRHRQHSNQVLYQQTVMTYYYKPKPTHHLCQGLKILFVPIILLLPLEVQAHATKLSDMHCLLTSY